MAIDKDLIKESVRNILIALGDDPDRAGLKETPDRVARMYEEVFEGIGLTNDEIAENDYNLSVSTYVEAEDTREKIDIRKLNAEIEEIVAREDVLRKEIAKIIAEIEGTDA